MLRNGKKIKAFSLVEIVVSLAIFSFIFSLIIGISLMLIKTQTKVQAQVFLTQTAQTLINEISQNLRYGYAYSGGDISTYLLSGQNIRLQNNSISQYENTSICLTKTNEEGVEYKVCPLVLPDTGTTNSQITTNITNSPFVVFETKDGDPTTYSDQNAYCMGPRNDGNLTIFKLESFNEIQSGGAYVEDSCNSSNNKALDMLPYGIKLEYVSFDIYGESSENPTNPMVRVKIKLISEIGGEVSIQTTITQRLVQIL